jgi:diguanylate cyclase (GGDEF)-like protein
VAILAWVEAMNSLENFKKSGIGRRIALLVAVSVFSAMIMLAAFLSTMQVKRDIEAKRTAMEDTAYVFASAIADNVESRDRAQIQRVLRSIARVPAILHITVVDETDAIIAQMGNITFLQSDLVGGEPNIFTMLTKGNLPITVNIIRGGQTVGKLYLIADITDIRSKLFWTLLTTLLASLGAALLAFPISRPLQHKISAPIIALTKAMTNVRETRIFKPAEIKNAAGETRSLVDSFNSMISDIQSRDVAMQRLAYFDPLTGLPNRVHFQKMLDEVFAKSGEMKSAAVILADIDNFHAINDAMGHSIGDAVLLNIAALFKEEAGENFHIARLGGDEFAILMPGVATQNEAQIELARFIAALYQPVKILDHELHITASIGVVLLPEHASNTGDVQRHMDLALYDAKQSGTGCVSFFRPEMVERIKAETELAQGLRIALVNNELEVHFQPVVSLSSGLTEGFEALARWKHPTKGYIPPMKFIPVAEKSGLISAIGDWILRASCVQAKAWKDAGQPQRFVAINISAAQILQVGFLDSVRNILRETQLPPELLCLELTESLFVGKSMLTVQKMLAEFKSLGIRTALDDFGTGYSSLSYLEHLPFDKLKIDRAFVSGMQQGQKNIELMKGIINLAHALGMSVVAEGAETVAEVSLLRQLNADTVQGYAYAKPEAAEQALARANEIDQQAIKAVA